MSNFLRSLGIDVRKEKIIKVRAKKEKVVKSIKEKLIEYCESQIRLIDKEGLESSNKGKCWSGDTVVEDGNWVRELYIRGEKNRKYYFGVEGAGEVSYVLNDKNTIKMTINGIMEGIRECDEKDFMSGGDKECVYMKKNEVISVDSGEVLLVIEMGGKKK
jgi:hypothetical protein